MSNLFKILPGEGQKLFLFFTLGLLIQGGMALGMSATDALFLTELGADKLPIVYLLLPVAMIFYTPFSSYLQTRFSIESVVRITLSILITGSLTIAVFLAYFEDHPYYSYGIYATKLFTAIWFIGIYTIFWNYVDAYFDLSEGKRLYGIINGGASLGFILAGSFLANFSERLPLSSIFYVWAVLSLMAFAFTYTISHLLKKLEYDDSSSGNASGLRSMLSSTGRALKKSRYALFVALLYFLLPLLSTFNEYLCFTVISGQGDEQEIAALFGQLYSIANIANLIISLFVFNFLAGRIGVRNIVLIQPIVYFFAFFWYFADYSLAAAYFGFFAYQTLLTSVDNNNANFIFNALPANDKRQLRTFIEGLGEPLAIALSGYFLLAYADGIDPSNIALVAVSLALLLFLIAYVINQLYVEGILTNLRLGWLDITKASRFRTKGSQDDRKEVLHKIIKQESPAEQLEAIYLMSKLDAPDAARELVCLLPDLPEPCHRRALEIIGFLLEHDDLDIKAVFKDSIHLSDSEKLSWILATVIPYGILPIDYFESSNIDAGDLRVERAALSLMSGKGRIMNAGRYQKSASKGITEKEYIYILGSANVGENIRYLCWYLNDSTFRLDALKSLRNLVGPGMQLVAKTVVSAMPAASEAELDVAFDIFRKIRDSESLEALLTTRTDFTPQERRNITELILDIGLRSVPVLLKLIQNQSMEFETRSIALNALTKLSFPQIEPIWEDLLSVDLERANKYHRFAESLPKDTDEAGIQFLCVSLRDTQRRSLEWILELLGVAGKIPNISLVLSSLNSSNFKERSNGVETIIEGAGMKLYNQLLPHLNVYFGTEHQTKSTSSTFSIQEVIADCLNSGWGHLVDAACYVAFKGEAQIDRSFLWEMMDQDGTGMISHCVNDLLKAESDRRLLSRIEMLICLRNAAIFESLKVGEIHSILSYFDSVSMPPNQALEPDKMYVSLENGTRYRGESGNEFILDSGDNMGLNRILDSNDPRQIDITVSESKFISINADGFNRVMCVFPQLSMRVYSNMELVR